MTHVQNVKAQIAESQKIASGGGSEQDIAEAKIELDVCCSLAILQTAYTNMDNIGFGEPAGRPEINLMYKRMSRKKKKKKKKKKDISETAIMSFPSRGRMYDGERWFCVV